MHNKFTNYGKPVIDDIKIKNWSEIDALKDAEAVFIATDHTGYTEIIKEFANKNKEVWIEDIWNVG